MSEFQDRKRMPYLKMNGPLSFPSSKSGWPSGMPYNRPRTEASLQLSNTMPDGCSLPRISIVTPSYNQAEFIEATIQSVLRQGYPNLEYIIVDGGSTDGSVDIIRSYERELAFWVTRPDNSMYDAINEGFARSTGEVMAWLNSDDMYMPWTFRTVSEIFMQHKERVRWICGLSSYWNTSNMLAAVNSPMRSVRQLIRLGVYENRRLGFIQQESTFWSRSLWEQSGGAVDTTFRLAGDFDLWRRFAKFAQLFMVETVLSGFRMHGKQQTAHALDKYYVEVDRCLKDQPGSRLRALLGNKIMLQVLFLAMRVSNIRHTVRYDPSTNLWTVTG